MVIVLQSRESRATRLFRINLVFPVARVHNPTMRVKPNPPPKIITSPVVVDPNAVFDLASARATLGLKKATIGRELRLGRLRVSKRAGKYYILGEWLLEWLRTGEITSAAHPSRSTNTSEKTC